MILISSCSTKPSDTSIQNNNTTMPSSSQYTPGPADIASPEGLPPVGKWMYQTDMQRAHWLGVKWEGKNLIEPINIILIDEISGSADQAKKRLRENLEKAGYSDRRGHSSGYLGYIDGTFYPQIPEEKDHAFSNRIAGLNNNHGRIFGPCFSNGRYYFTAALSREVVAPFAKVKHHYGSFSKARDEFAESLDRKSDYKIAGTVNLDNLIVGNSESTTGDHDGKAVVLKESR
jgi:hypothetical protein